MAHKQAVNGVPMLSVNRGKFFEAPHIYVNSGY